MPSTAVLGQSLGRANKVIPFKHTAFERDRLARESSTVEKLREYLFISELAQEAFFLYQNEPLQISRPDVDNSGYDLIVEFRRIVRHIQLKGSIEDARAVQQKVNIRLADKPSGAVIWMVCRIDEAPARRFRVGHYLVFGGPAGEPLPALGNKVAKHTKADSHGVKNAREGHRVVRRGLFRSIPDTRALFNFLFFKEIKQPISPEEIVRREEAHTEIYNVLGRRYDTGDETLAEWHNDHQP